MAEYTNPAHTSGATMTTGVLVNSTVANIDKTGEDAYARALTLNTNASATGLSILAGGTASLSGANVAVDGFTLTNGGATPTLRVSTGALVENGTTDGTVSLYVYGGTARNVIMGAGCYCNVNTNGILDGGSFNGTRLGIGGATKGTVKNLVIKKTTESEGSNCVRALGEFIDCTISKGAVFRVSGGLAERTVVSGANARFIVSTGSANATTVVSGGSLIVVGGTVNGTLISSGGKLHVSGGAVGEVTLRGSGTATTVIYASNGTIDKITASGGGIQIMHGAVVNELIVSNAAATGAPKVWISSGGTVNGGHTDGGFELRMESGGGLIRNFSVGSGTYLYWSAGHASNITIASNAGKIRFYGSTTDALTIESATIYRKKDASDNRGLVNGTMIDCQIMSGGYLVQSNGVNRNLRVNSGATFDMSNGVASALTVSGNNANANISAGTVSGVLIEDYGRLNLYGGATLYDPVLRMNSATTIAGKYARLTLGSNNGLTGGVVEGGHTEGSRTLEIYLYSGGVIRNMVYNNGAYNAVYSTAEVSGGIYNSGATLSMRGGRVENITVNDGATVNGNQFGGEVDGAVINSGGRIYASSGAVMNDVSVLSGGSVYVYCNVGKVNNMTVDSGAMLRLNFSGAVPEERTDGMFDTLAGIDTVIDLRNVESDKVYRLADTGNTALRMTANYDGFTVDVNADGTPSVNPFGQKYTLGGQGQTLTVDGYAIQSEVAEAKSLLEEYDSINNGDRAIEWNGVVMTSGAALTFADGTVPGNGWVELDTVDLDAGAVIYGAGGNYGGTMNYRISGGQVGNFAAGAAAGGQVGGVKAVVYDAVLAGMTYMGGMGTVGNVEDNVLVGEVNTVVSSGAQINKDFYGGALANYNKTHTRTAVGSIDTRIAMSTEVEKKVGDETETETIYGKVAGNLYGASAVKAGSIDTSVAGFTPLHTVGEVTLSVTAGEATNSKFCVFAGGYATGSDSAKTAPIYTVEGVTATVSGGSWGTVHGGRGIFGGAFASDVMASVGAVNLTVSGGSMGNVYGGGWAQKGGKSEVGDVNISIRSTAEVANVFGGGSHSTSGGTTAAGNVTITVSGGTITGDIYARGQLVGDVTASSTVIFTGANDFACDVYGYTYVDGEDSDATLVFSSYTGTLSGAIGGFGSVTFSGGTRMALAAADAAAVSNTVWNFDFTDRTDSFAASAALSWNGETPLELVDNSQIRISFADGAQALAGWSIASAVDASKAVFDLKVGDETVVSGLAYNTAIADGDYKDWGFAVEEGVLKFAKLA